MPKPKSGLEFDLERVRDISVAVYLDRLGPDAEKMIDEIGRDGVRKRAVSYDTLTKAYLRAMRNVLGMIGIGALLLIAACCANRQPPLSIIGQPVVSRGYAPAYPEHNACPQSERIQADHELCRASP